MYIGAYGWVDDPKPQIDVADSAGYIHAPSVAHAAAGAVLRNAFLTHTNVPLENPFAINFSSERVRRALELIEGVRMGQPLSVLLGFQFERGLHEAQKDVYIDTFRSAFPLVASKEVPSIAGLSVEAVAARNVVDGMRLAIEWRKARGSAPVPAATWRVSATVEVNDSRVIEQLEGLIESLDSVGDVLLTEGVFQSVQGNFERAGAALDALAGVSAPADLESVETPLPGTAFENRLCVLFSGSAVAPGASGPRAIAEPRIASWIADILGPASLIRCTASFVPEGSTGPATRPVALTELGLDVVDLLYISSFPPAGELTEIERRIAYHIRRTVAVKDGSLIAIDFERSSASTRRGLAEAMEVARRAWELIGGAMPLQPNALVLPEQAHAVSAIDANSYLDVRERIDAARTALNAKADSVAAGLAAVTDGQRIDAAGPGGSLSGSLLDLSRFGIENAIPDSPVMDAAMRARLNAAIDEARERSARCGRHRAQAEVYSIGWAPADDLAGELGGTAPRPRYDKAVEELHQAMKALFGERFVVLPTFTLPTAAGTELGQALSQVHMGGGDQPDRILLWLQQVAQTHASAARLEDALLASDAWLTGAMRPGSTTTGVTYEFAVATPRTLRVAQLPYEPSVRWNALSDDERETAIRPRGRVGIVALAPVTFNASGLIAGLMLEQWQETIPGEDVRTGLSFYYNRPNALAPQSLLLAVPHTLGPTAASWCLSDLVEIVRDTADLARARAVDPDALDEMAALLPGLLVPVDMDRPAYQREVLVPTIKQVTAAIAASCVTCLSHLPSRSRCVSDSRCGRASSRVRARRTSQMGWPRGWPIHFGCSPASGNLANSLRRMAGVRCAASSSIAPYHSLTCDSPAPRFHSRGRRRLKRSSSASKYRSSEAALR